MTDTTETKTPAFLFHVPAPVGRLEGHDTLFNAELNRLRANARLSPYEYWNAWRPLYQSLDLENESNSDKYVIMRDIGFAWRSCLDRETNGLPPIVCVNVYNFETIMILLTIAVIRWNALMEEGIFVEKYEELCSNLNEIQYIAVVFKRIQTSFLTSWIKPPGTVLPPEVDVNVMAALHDLCVTLAFAITAHTASVNSPSVKNKLDALALKQYHGGYKRAIAVLETLRNSDAAKANRLSNKLVEFVMEVQLYCFKGFITYVISTVENFNGGQNYGEVIWHLQSLENTLQSSILSQEKSESGDAKSSAVSKTGASSLNSVGSIASTHAPCLAWLTEQITAYKDYNQEGKPIKNSKKWKIPSPSSIESWTVLFPLDCDVHEDTVFIPTKDTDSNKDSTKVKHQEE